MIPAWLRRWWPRRASLGNWGERLAARHLRRKGYRILEANVRCGRCEIDLVAQDGDTLVFVEVKTRRRADAVAPEENVGPAKQRHLRQAAAIYLARQPGPPGYARFDIVAITALPGQPPEILHIENAFSG